MKPVFEIYNTFKGEMPACAGKDCEASCCAPKLIYTRDKGQRQYFTTMEIEELDVHQKLFGSLAELGIDHEEVDINTDRGAPDFRVLIRNCLSDTEGCKLAHRKPLQCRIFPFSVSIFSPLRHSCPHAIEIARDERVLNSVIEVRKLLGINNHEDWLESIKRFTNWADD